MHKLKRKATKTNGNSMVFPLKKNVVYRIVVIIIVAGLFPRTKANAQPTIWKLQDTNLVAGHKPVVLGKPMALNDNGGRCLSFNGINDGLVVTGIPVEGWSRFTIEVLFKPAGNGPVAPRFIHFQDKDLNRGTFEARLTPNSLWYMDTFLKNGKTDKGLTLIDSTILHPADQWYWAALVYDGKKMTSYVNRRKELEGDINFPAMTQGDIALGVRLNKVNWFKGLIKEIRFHDTALDPSAMQHL